MREIDLEEERLFENSKARAKAKGENIRSSQSKFYWSIDLSVQKHNNHTFNIISGKEILEIGCASGRDASEYTKYTNSYVGVDISDEAIGQARSLCLDGAEFLCIDGHKIPKNDECFDCVVVNSLLHHMDLSLVFPEIHRVLKGDGILVFKEPLGINPIFQFYRLITPYARTVDERPFNSSDLKLMRVYFSLENTRWFGFLCIASAFVRLKALRRFLTSVDDLLSRTPIRFVFWQFCGFARRRPLKTIAK